MRQALVLAIAIPSLATACVDDVGVGSTRGPIIDGRPAAAADVGATVALLDPRDGYPFCTGTLVAPTVVVTAAHCVLTPAGWDDFGPPIEPSAVVVAVGATDAVAAAPEQTHAVETVWAHPEFPGAEWDPTDPLTGEHDIGALVLAAAVDAPAVPVLAPPRVDAELTPRRMLDVAGYGTTDRAGWAENTVLHVAEVPFIRRSEVELIAGDANAVDTCYGDSGGPLYVHAAEGVRLVGVTSRGVDQMSEGCDSGTVATLAPAYADLLAEATGVDTTRPAGGMRPDPPPPPTAGDAGVAWPPDLSDPPPAAAAPTGDSGGCGCRVAPAALPPGALVLPIGLLILAWRRRG
jgi:MYXO-CTERM domain-containing protein